MARRFLDGFANYNSLADLQTKWSAESSSAPSAATVGTGFTFETGADNRKPVGASLGIASGSALVFHTDAIFVRGEAFNLAVSRDVAGARTLLGGSNSGITGWSLVWRADGAFELFDYAGVSQGVSSAFANDTHHHHFITLIVPITAPATVKLYEAGTLQKTWTGVNTQPGGSTNFVHDYWIGGVSGTAGTGCKFYISDVFLESFAAASPPTSAAANIEIDTGVPIGDGDKSEWVNSAGNSIANWSYVDEIPTDTADFIECGFSKVDLYQFAAARGIGIHPQLTASVRYNPSHALSDQSVEAWYKAGGTEHSWGSFATYRNLEPTYELRSVMLETGFVGDETAATQWGVIGNRIGSASRPSDVASVSLEWATAGLVIPSGWGVGVVRMA